MCVVKACHLYISKWLQSQLWSHNSIHVIYAARLVMRRCYWRDKCKLLSHSDNWRQRQVYLAGINNCIPQNTVGRNYLSMLDKPALLMSHSKHFYRPLFNHVQSHRFIANWIHLMCRYMLGSCWHENIHTVVTKVYMTNTIRWLQVILKFTDLLLLANLITVVCYHQNRLPLPQTI